MIQEFREELISKIKKLKSISTTSLEDKAVVDTQLATYRSFVAEVDDFIISKADEESDKFNYLYDNDYEDNN